MKEEITYKKRIDNSDIDIPWAQLVVTVNLFAIINIRIRTPGIRISTEAEDKTNKLPRLKTRSALYSLQ